MINRSSRTLRYDAGQGSPAEVHIWTCCKNSVSSVGIGVRPSPGCHPHRTSGVCMCSSIAFASRPPSRFGSTSNSHNCRVRQTLPDHRVFGRRQVPSRRSWGHMYALKIVVLVTGRAIHWRNANTVASAPNIHEVPMQIISLTRVVSAGMADHATRMFQDRKHFLKRSEACFPADRMLH